MKTFAFIGMGNMARAIAQGFLASDSVSPAELCAFAPHYDRLAAFCEPLGIAACKTAREALDGADAVIMAVKPYVLSNVLDTLGDSLAGKAILSVVAGWTLEKYTDVLPEGTRVQYIMPNTPCAVREGMLLFEEATSLDEAERARAIELFSALGQVAVLPTKLMNVGMALSGCGPAFVAMMIEALADAGVKYGLPRDAAYRLASQTVVGTGRLQLETGIIFIHEYVFPYIWKKP